MVNLFRKTGYISIALIFLSGICFSEISSGDVVESVGEGKINYSVGVIQATGVGAPPENTENMAQKRAMAKRAAVVVARRNLLEVVKGVRLDSETIVENFIVKSDIIRTQVNGFIENSQVISTQEFPDGSVEVTIEMPLRGSIVQSLVKNMGSSLGSVKAGEAGTPSQAYTGLIIDCTGLNLKPAMAPRILSEEKKEIYGSAYVESEYAIQQGMAGYVKSIEQAKKNERVGQNPLVIKGLKADGAMSADVVISSSDSGNLQNLNETHTFLRQCRVIFII